MISDLIDEVLSGDRVVFSFATVWVFAIVVWITLDYIGNPNRGRFRPQGNQFTGTRTERRDAARRRRAEDDAAIRATLRDAYGASSLRLNWTRAREAEALESDEMLVRPDPRPAPVERPPLRTHLPWLRDEFQDDEPLLGTLHEEPFDAAPGMPRGRWRRGDDPLKLSTAGKPPTAVTVRSRVWKNHCDQAAWGSSNNDRMRAGKPPRRYNPLNGSVETGVVDLRTARPGWRIELIDPFGASADATSGPAHPS